MHASIQARRDILSALKQRSAIATHTFYQMVGRDMQVTSYRFQVKPAGRDFFHVLDTQSGKIVGFRRAHNEACALARLLEGK